MSDVLKRINGEKRDLVAGRKARTPWAEMERLARAQPPARGFEDALRSAVSQGRYGLIAEIKKASPSVGLIRADFDPATLARAYEKGGASCLSVLTDTPNFQGQDSYLQEARAAVTLPALRKDFMVDPWQILESRALGADCILLILASLDDALAVEMESLAFDLGMDVLIETHDEAEFERAITRLKSPLVGVNNRNLKTLKVDIATAERLLPGLPKDRLGIAESGLKTPADLARMARAGAQCFLVGESLMREQDVEAATRTLLTKE
ncbi:MAG: indole-3-glycerol phosphate synthase TrpC [Rhodospirillales bacterium]|nr:MAG: indole-3-glycerol phosphate synthase TrpC [Rhodospirillales bacterium]